MKRELRFAAFCVFGSLATGTYAQEGTPDASRFTGHFEVYGGRLDIRPLEFSPRTLPRTPFYGVAAKGNYAVTPRFNLQLDGSVDYIEDAARSEVAPDVYSYPGLTSFNATVHAYWRNPDSFAAGIFGSWSHADRPAPVAFDQNTGYPTRFGHLAQDLLSTGVEGQVYVGPVTMFGQAYLGRRYREEMIEAFPPTFDTFGYAFIGARGGVRYYPTDNLKLEAEVGYVEEKISFQERHPETTNTWRLAAQVTYRFDNMPISVFARIQHEDPFNEGDDKWGTQPSDSQRISVGARFAFGTNSLRDEERFGPAMDTVQRSNLLRR